MSSADFFKIDFFCKKSFKFKQYFISEFTSIIQYILMYSGTGFDSKPKLIFKSFPITMWIMQKLYENGTLAINVR